MSEASLDAVLKTIPYGAQPLPGVVTAGQPGAPAWRALHDAGVRTIIDLRAPNEPRGHDEAAAVREAGLEYVALPVTQDTLSDDDFDRVRAMLADDARRPVVIHCATSNRVGAVLLPYLVLDRRLSAGDAVALARHAGLRSPELATIALDYIRRQHHAG